MLLFVGLPVPALPALISLVGIPLGVALLLALIPLGALGHTTSMWLLDRALLAGDIGRGPVFLAGRGVLSVALLLPVAGFLAWLMATIFGVGTLAVAGRRAGGAAGARMPERQRTPAAA